MINRALIIGINYNGTAFQLNGCINDGQRLYDYLISQGWNESEIKFINDDTEIKPTYDNVLNCIDWLIGEPSLESKNLLFHYSGHGSQMEDQDFDEQDGKDETICCIDYDMTDDVISERLTKNLKTDDVLTVFFDCCHSGTMMDFGKTPFNGTLHSISACMDFQYAEELQFDTKRKDEFITSGVLSNTLLDILTDPKHDLNKMCVTMLDYLITINIREFSQKVQFFTCKPTQTIKSIFCR
jgi:hypothetical protein